MGRIVNKEYAAGFSANSLRNVSRFGKY